MSIEQEILNWDGKSASGIGEVYDRHCNDKLFLKTILEHSYEMQLQKGATWLLKQYLENGNRMGTVEV